MKTTITVVAVQGTRPAIVKKPILSTAKLMLNNSEVLHCFKNPIKKLKLLSTMKKMIILISLICLICGSDIFAQSKAFIPDTNFRNFLNADYPTFMDGDSLIIASAVTLVGLLNCSYYNIADLTGIEYFVNITQLICLYNQLTTLPSLTINTALH